MVKIIKLRCVPAAAGEGGDQKAISLMKGILADCHGSDDGQLARCEFEGKRVLFLNLRERPATRPIKLHNNRIGVIQAHLINPVFIAVERKQSEITVQTNRFYAAHHTIWS